MRVIAGRFRGRPILAPHGMTTRPTMDRAREAIFNILGDLTGARALDLYAGSGAMGIEALSRGAEKAVFVEADRGALDVIRKNLQKLGIERQSTLVEVPVERSGKRLSSLGPFDLVMSDPPWAISQESAVAVAKLVEPLLAPGARVLLGHPTTSPVEIADGPLALVQRRKWGGTGMSFFEVASAETEP